MLDKETLERMYWIEGKSQRQIAKELGVKYKTVYRSFRSFQIPVRRGSEAKMMQYRGTNPFIQSGLLKAYLAGFIDGEGCITIHKQPPTYPIYISVTNTKTKILELLATNYGGKITTYAQKLPNRKPIHRWCVANIQAVKLIKDILPYLRLKKKVAELCLLLHQTITDYRRRYPACRGTEPSELSRRFSIYSQVKELNKRGGD